MPRIEDFHIGASPYPELALAARRYQAERGLHVPVREDYARVSMPRTVSQSLGRAYGNLPSSDPRALPAFRAMREEVGKQYDFLTRPQSRGGLGIDIEPSDEDPYGRHDPNDIINEIRHDVQENRRIQVLSSASTGGHPFFTADQNDMFRGVHDLFGHLGSGRGVDMHGEEASFQKHARMFSPLARQALASETRGQNSAFHLGGDFPEQKVALLPMHMQSAQFSRRASGDELRAAASDARLENRKQRL